MNTGSRSCVPRGLKQQSGEERMESRVFYTAADDTNGQQLHITDQVELVRVERELQPCPHVQTQTQGLLGKGVSANLMVLLLL